MNSNNTHTLIRTIATLAAVALPVGTASANTNTPTVQSVHHWSPPVSNAKALQRSVTIAVFNQGRGLSSKRISHK